MATQFPEHVARAMRLAYAHRDERPRRIDPANEALGLGHGVVARVAAVLGSRCPTTERGLAERRRADPFPPGRRHRKKAAAGRRVGPSSRTSIETS